MSRHELFAEVVEPVVVARQRHQVLPLRFGEQALAKVKLTVRHLWNFKLRLLSFCKLLWYPKVLQVYSILLFLFQAYWPLEELQWLISNYLLRELFAFYKEEFYDGSGKLWILNGWWWCTFYINSHLVNQFVLRIFLYVTPFPKQKHSEVFFAIHKKQLWPFNFNNM